MNEKKKRLQESGWATALFFFCTGSRYSKLYRDTGQLGATRGAMI